MPVDKWRSHTARTSALFLSHWAQLIHSLSNLSPLRVPQPVPRSLPGVQLRDEPYDDHVVYCSRQRMAVEYVQREDGASHVHSAVDKRVSNGLRGVTGKVATAKRVRKSLAPQAFRFTSVFTSIKNENENVFFERRRVGGEAARRRTTNAPCRAVRQQLDKSPLARWFLASECRHILRLSELNTPMFEDETTSRSFTTAK